MFAVSVRNTERGIRLINKSIKIEERNRALQLQRERYETELEHKRLLADLKREAEQKAEDFAAGMRDAGIPYRHTYREIERRACRVFRTKPSEIHSDRRNREIVLARQFVMYWAARLTKLSLPQVGRLMGGKDHTTILHGKDKYVEKRARMGRYLRAAR